MQANRYQSSTAGTLAFEYRFVFARRKNRADSQSGTRNNPLLSASGTLVAKLYLLGKRKQVDAGTKKCETAMLWPLRVTLTVVGAAGSTARLTRRRSLRSGRVVTFKSRSSSHADYSVDRISRSPTDSQAIPFICLWCRSETALFNVVHAFDDACQAGCGSINLQGD